MASMPTNIASGRVVGRFIFGVVDGADEGEEPDFVPANGTVTFTPSIPYIPSPTADGGPVTIVPAAVVAVLDSEGYLCTPDPEDPKLPGYRGVRLFATDDLDLSVTNWTWQVAYRLQAVPGASAAIPPHSIALPEGAELDLSKMVKVPSSPGVGVPQAEAAVIRAEAAATDSAASAEEAIGVAGEARVAAQSVVDRADAGEFKGDKGDPGGWVTGTWLGTQDLNTVTVDGPYRQDLSANATPERNYPVPSAGALLAYQIAGSQTMCQQYIASLGTSTGARNMWIRMRNGGTWSEWRAFASQRVDNTAGRAIYQWDDTASREQLIYGDTGWREIEPTVGTAGWVRVRREGFTVSLAFTGVNLVDATPETPFAVLPAGFCSGNSSINGLIGEEVTGVFRSFSVSWDGKVYAPRAGTAPRATAYSGFFTWSTIQKWPTILPGTAAGTIPNL